MHHAELVRQLDGVMAHGGPESAAKTETHANDTHPKDASEADPKDMLEDLIEYFNLLE